MTAREPFTACCDLQELDELEDELSARCPGSPRERRQRSPLFGAPRWPAAFLDRSVFRSARRLRWKILGLFVLSSTMLATIAGASSASFGMALTFLAPFSLFTTLLATVPILKRAMNHRALEDLRTELADKRESLVALMASGHREELVSLESMVASVRGCAPSYPLAEPVAERLEYLLLSYAEVAIHHRRTTELYRQVEGDHVGCDQVSELPKVAALAPSSSAALAKLQAKKTAVGRLRGEIRASCRERLSIGEAYLDSLSQLIRLAYERAIAGNIDTASLVDRLDAALSDLENDDLAHREVSARRVLLDAWVSLPA